MPCHIRGFGACMIGGFPHRQEDAFFHHAIERLRLETPFNIIDSIFTFGGFPVTRVPKHLKARCLAAHPDIVVVQFGSSDLVVPLRHRSRSGSSGNGASVQRQVSKQLPGFRERLKWSFRSVVGDVFRLTPVTAPEVYLETVTQMARTLAEHDVIPVVLSPFIFGSARSDRIARDCVGRLQQSLAPVSRAVYVDVYAALNRHPRRQMLLADGTHLSLTGQQVVGDILFPVLKRLVEQGAWRTKLVPREP